MDEPGLPTESAESPAVPPAGSSRPVSHAVTYARAFRDLATPANLTLGALALALGVIGLLGGWQNLETRPDRIKAVAAKQETEASPFKLKVVSVRSFSHIPALLPLEPNERGWLVITDLTNTSKKPVGPSELQKLLRLTLPGLKDEKPVLILRGSDGLSQSSLQPGLPSRLALLWVQDASRPRPREVSVQVFGQTYRQSGLSGGMAYFDPTETARVRLPAGVIAGSP